MFRQLKAREKGDGCHDLGERKQTQYDTCENKGHVGQGDKKRICFWLVSGESLKCFKDIHNVCHSSLDLSFSMLAGDKET